MGASSPILHVRTAFWPLVASLLCVLVVAQPASADGERSPAGGSAGATVSIVGGKKTMIGKWPWQVALAMRGTKSPRKRTYCGGALIAPGVAATAGHCVIDDAGEVIVSDRLEVIAGRTDLNSGAGEVAAVAEVIVPEVESHLSFYEGVDVALLRLEVPLSQTPIKLAGSDEAAAWAPGQVAWTTGWGARSARDSSGPLKLRVTRQVMLPPWLCGDYWRSEFDLDVMTCLGAPAGNSGTCMGDSGGPLVVRAGRGYRLVGLTSFGDGECAPFVPRVVSRVAGGPIRRWIETTARGLTGNEVVGSGGKIPRKPGWCRVPSLERLTMRKARKRLKRNRCRLGKVKRIRTWGSYRRHQVVDTFLPTGWLAPRGFRLRVKVSR